MDKIIEELANRCAINVLSEQIDKVKQAYIAGYNEAKGIVVEDNVTYIDLGLQSGTLWATKFIGATEGKPEGCRMVYEDAKSFSLPTEEQFLELHRLPYKINETTIDLYGCNGNILSLPLCGFVQNGDLVANNIHLWLRDKEPTEWNSVRVGSYFGKSYAVNANNKDYVYLLFMGSLLPVLTVKKAK